MAEQQLEELISTLNPAQRRAVETTEGPLLVLAGAGSGKTRVLTLRIAYLIAHGIPAESILALTFTNKAAAEMRTRIADVVGNRLARQVHAGTFHSIFLRILRDYAVQVGYRSGFSIYDVSATEKTQKLILKELGLDKESYRPKTVQNYISSAKNQLVTAQVYSTNPEIQAMLQSRHMPRIADVYVRYQQELLKSNAMDFDDLLLNMFMLLKRFPDVRQRMQAHFSHILVDEFQDTNIAQSKILQLLTNDQQNICVVGDDSQSIYGFRGAEVRNILNFQKAYRGAQEVKLELNYRSTGAIVEAANRLISHNAARLKKQCRSAAVGSGEPVAVEQFYNMDEEMAFVARDIQRMALTRQIPYSHFAVLYRTNAMSNAVESACRKVGVPTVVYGGISFFSRMEVQDLLAYIRVVCNPEDQEALLRIINKPRRGIGEKSIQNMLEDALAQNQTLWSYLHSLVSPPKGMSRKGWDALCTLCMQIDGWLHQLHQTEAAQLAQAIYVESGLQAMYAAEDINHPDDPDLVRDDNIRELLQEMEKSAAEYAEQGNTEQFTLPVFLDQVSLMTDADTKDKETQEARVVLSTVHSSKGLEFDYVYVVGLDQQLFPLQRAIEEQQIEEERRLCYVAFTRAAKRLVLTRANVRYLQGRQMNCLSSQFLREAIEGFEPLYDSYVNGPGNSEAQFEGYNQRGFRGANLRSDRNREDAIRVPKPRAPFGQGKVRQQLTPELVDRTGEVDLPFQAGERVVHDKFGKGVVKQIMGDGANMRVKVLFDDEGERILLLQYAKLRKA
jgi:ATP-dependent DNA helicase pcrA